MAQKYQKGDHVCYGTNGVCLIEDVREMSITKEKDTFYVLRPLGDCHSTFFIPVRNETLTNKMRELISRDEIDAMIDSLQNDAEEWIEDRKTRMEVFREILRQSDPRALLRLCGVLYRKKQLLSEHGKRMSPSDESILKQAEDLTEGEFSFVLDIPTDDVGPYIRNRLKLDL